MVIPMTLFPYMFARISLSNFSEWSKAFPSLTCFFKEGRTGRETEEGIDTLLCKVCGYV